MCKVGGRLLTVDLCRKTMVFSLLTEYEKRVKERFFIHYYISFFPVYYKILYSMPQKKKIAIIRPDINYLTREQQNQRNGFKLVQNTLSG
jgi:hypothetical protein